MNILVGPDTPIIFYVTYHSDRRRLSSMEVNVGCPVPPHTPHAISVSLPKWRDVVGYEEGEKRILDCMWNGYPRFFIHLSIVKVFMNGSYFV